MHAMGPFLAQGGSCSLEDAVVLTHCLSKMVPEGVIAVDDDRKLAKGIKEGLMSYVKKKERS